MVERVQDLAADGGTQGIEVLNHAAGRAAGLERPPDRHLKPV